MSSFNLEDLLRDTIRGSWNSAPYFESTEGHPCSFSLVDWIPAYSISEESKTYVVSFERDETLSTFSSFKDNWAFISSANNIRSFVHDFTFGMWLTKTDYSLSSFFPSISPRFADLTPDYIGKVLSSYVVVEFTTRATGDRESLINAFREKRAKYTPALLDASRNEPVSIYFFIVVVGDNEIYTNLGLNQEEVTELGYRYKIAKTIKTSFIKDLGILEAIEEDMTDSEWDLISWLKSIKLTGMDQSGEFSNENIENLRRPSTVEDRIQFENYSKRIFQLSIFKSQEERRDYEKGASRALEKETESWHNYEMDFRSRYSPVNSPQNQTSLKAKTIANVPLISLKKVIIPTKPESLPSISRTSVLSNFWSDCLRQWKGVDQNEPMMPSDDNFGSLRDEVLEIIKIIRTRKSDEELKKEHAAQMRSRNRVVVPIDFETQAEFAKVGVKAKSLIWLPQVKEYREESKKSLDLSVDVSDVDRFLMEPSISNLARDTNDIVQEGLSRFQRSNLIRCSDEIMSGDCDVRFKFHETLHAILRSHLFNWAEIVSDIANELAISFKHHCNSSEFVVKKLKEYDLWLAICPTRSGSHIFFSLLWLQADMLKLEIEPGKVFRQWDTDGVWCWTDWVSLNSDKLTNWALLESRTISLSQYWMEFYGLEPLKFLELSRHETNESITPADLDKFTESMRMTMLSLLISLADKAEVEEIISCSRFIIMEGFTSYPCWPRPFKMYEKFPMHIKSRLTVWMIHKLRALSREICRKPYKLRPTGELTQEEVATNNPNPYYLSGFYNPFTGYKLRDAGQLINLMYLGYIKNKHETGQANTAGKLVEKIVTLENKFTPEVKSRIGREDKPFGSKTYHEWNINFLRVSCEKAIRELDQSNSGSSVQSSLGADWIRRLNQTSIEDAFCTLKATSNFDKDWFNYKESLERWRQKRRHALNKRSSNDQGMKNDYGFETADTSTQIPEIPEPSSCQWANHKHCYTRSKLIERCVQKMPDGEISMNDLIKASFAKITKNNYLRVCIFKKQQHGGLREIFVLGFEERIIQYAIELAGRIICEKFMGETMTHPQSKKLLILEHHRKVKARFKKGLTATTYTSADSSKWSQNQYCAKLLQVFLKFFPFEFHNFFIRALELWRKKKIKISDDLLFLIENNPEVKFWDPITQTLSDAYHGKISCEWMKKGNSYLDVKTGMMQGILHYSSSAFHSITNKAVEISCKSLIRSRKLGNLAGLGLEVTTMQSSDDSGMIVTVNMKSIPEDKITEVKKSLRHLAAAIHFYKALFSEEVAIKDSIKTTFNCQSIFEFNSKFHVVNQLYEPEIKLVYASNLISHCENMISKQEESYTLISSYISTGGSCYAAKWIQYSQAMFHYRTLGSNVSPYWLQLYRILKMTNDPSLGFFMVDHVASAGIPGFNFCHWAHVTKTDLSKTARYHLEKLTQSKSEGLRSRERETVEDLLGYITVGGVTRNNYLGFGEMAKVQRMKRNMGLPHDWVNYVDENPIILFRNARTKEELQVKAALKLSQDGVAASLSGSPAVSTNLASSIYVIQEHVMNLISSSLVNMDYLEPLPGDPTDTSSQSRERIFKYSLLELYMSSYQHNESRDLDYQQETILFPLAGDYSKLWDYLKTIVDFHYANKSWNKKRLSVEVQVYSGDSSYMVNPYSILSDIWFPNERTRLESKYGTNQTRVLFDHMKDTYAWLQDSPKETLLSSPFHNFLSLYNWFKTLSMKTRTISIVGAPINSNRGQTTVMAYIKLNAGRYHSLNMTREEGSPIREFLGNKQHITNSALNALTFPNSEQKMQFFRVFFAQYSNLHRYEMNRTHSKFNSLNVIGEVIKNSTDLTLNYSTLTFKSLRIHTTTLDKIQMNKEGCIGYWEIPQEKWNADLQRYEGLGCWTGLINGYRTVFYVKSYQSSASFNHIDRIETVDIPQKQEIQSWIKGVQTWSKDSNCSLDYMGPIRGHIMRLKRRTMCITSSGIPVFIHPIGHFKKIDWETGTNFSLTLPQDEVNASRLTIRLQYESLLDERKYTMLSVTLSARDWTSEAVPRDLIDCPLLHNNPFFGQWVLNKPLEQSQWQISIHQAKTSSFRRGAELVSNCLKGELIRKGVDMEKRAPQISIVSSRIALQDSFRDSFKRTRSTSSCESSVDSEEEDFFAEINAEDPIDNALLNLVLDVEKPSDIEIDEADTELEELDFFPDELLDRDLNEMMEGLEYAELDQPNTKLSVWELITSSHSYMRKAVQDLTERYRNSFLNSIINTGIYPPGFGPDLDILSLAFPRSYVVRPGQEGTGGGFQLWSE